MEYSEYKQEIKELAKGLVEDNQEYKEYNQSVFDYIRGNGLDHKTIDNHQWIIYYSYNLDVIKHSDNEDYMVDNLGSESLAHALEQGGLNGLHQVIAFYAMLADLNEALQELEQEEVEESE